MSSAAGSTSTSSSCPRGEVYRAHVHFTVRDGVATMINRGDCEF